MGVSESLDALANPYRRHILLALTEHNPQDDDEIAVSRGDETVSGEFGAGHPDQSLDTKLKHVHLPKLADYGYVTYEPETGRIEQGPNFDEIIPLLELIREHEDELPDDWL